MKLHHWIALGFLAVACWRAYEYHEAHERRAYHHCPHDVYDCHAWLRQHNWDN